MKNYGDPILFSLMSFFWALNFIFVKFAILYENVFYTLFFRIIFALAISLIIFPSSIIRERSLKLHLKLLLLSFLNIFIFMEFWFLGEMTENASLSTIIIYSYPLINVILSLLILNEKITKLNFIGVIIGFTGIIIIFSAMVSIHSYLGVSFLLISALGWSLGTVYYKKNLSYLDPIRVNTMQFIYSLPFVLLAALLSGPLIEKNLNAEFISITFYMGTLGTFVAMLIYLYLIKKYTVTKVSPFLFLVPLFSVILGFIILGEKLTISSFIGFFLVMAGVYLSQTKYFGNYN